MPDGPQREFIRAGKVSPQGQISLPRDLMRRSGISPGEDRVYIVVENDRIVILTERQWDELMARG